MDGRSRKLGLICAALAWMGLPLAALGHAEVVPSSGVTVHPVLNTLLTDAGGRYASMVTVTLEPGGSTDPHRHPGTVLVYVLEGEVESAVDDGEAQTFKAGESWIESPGALHRVSRNTSEKVAKLLAVLIHSEGDGLVLPKEPHAH